MGGGLLYYRTTSYVVLGSNKVRSTARSQFISIITPIFRPWSIRQEHTHPLVISYRERRLPNSAAFHTPN